MGARRQTIYAIAASVALVVTGAAAAYASGVPGMPYAGLLTGVAASTTGTEPAAEAAGLKVTGVPAGGTGTFAGGATIAWRVDAAAAGLDPEQYLEYMGGDSEVWTVAGVSADDASALEVVGLDAENGAVKWRAKLGEQPHGVRQALCAPEANGGSIVCATDVYAESGPVKLERIRLSDGKVQRRTDLAELGVEDAGFVDSLHVFGGSVVVRWLSTSEETGGSPTGGVVARLAGDLSKVEWQTPFHAACGGGSGWPTVERQYGDLLVLSNSQAGTALDFATGKLLLNPSCGLMDAYGKDGLMVTPSNPEEVDGSSVKLDSGRSVTVAASTRVGVEAGIVDFSGSAVPSPVPLLYGAGDVGGQFPPVVVEAYQATGASVWSATADGAAAELAGAVYGASDGDRLVVIDLVGHVLSLDAKSGQARWSAGYESLTRGENEASATRPRPMFATDGTVLVADQDSDSARPMLIAFDPATGAKLWEHDGGRAEAQASVGDRPAIVLLGVGADQSISALVPAGAADAGVVAAPSELPSCPAGMKPVSWSSYPAGHILVCSGSQRYTVDYVRKGHAVSCPAIAFTGAGFTLTCANRERVVAIGGGALLQISTRGSSWVQPATQAWSVSVGSKAVGFAAGSQKVPLTCPAGSRPISFSTWKGGWLLICGTDAMHVTSFAYTDGESGGDGSEMTLDSGRYCGSSGSGVTVCASATPALVTFSQSGRDDVQRSVASNYFEANGFSGAGQGTGAYDVAAPKDTAADQVRYLVEILQKSQTGRAQVSSFVPRLLRCTISADDVATASSIVSNRQELVDALQTTPFDQVPDGARLIAELSEALQVSLEADQQYVSAAKQMSGGDCGTGLSTARDAITIADRTDALKQTFVDDWNTHIAGRYPQAAALSADTI
jgi:outer membrane protein assembly factor BamB